MRLLKLPSEVQKLVVDKRLAMGHVRPLLGLKDETEMLDAAEKILKEKMSVREVEAYVRDINAEEVKTNKTKPEKKRDPIIHDLEHQISVKLGTKVTIQNKKLTIQYTDIADLNRILEILNCLDEG